MPPQSKKTRKSSRRAARGGAQNEACLAAFFKAVPGNLDHEVMLENESESIELDQTYQDFMEFQEAQIKGLSADKCEAFIDLCSRISSKKIYIQNPKDSKSMPAEFLFFDKNGAITIVHENELGMF